MTPSSAGTDNMLVTSEWLESHLGDARVTIIDVSVVVGPKVDGRVSFAGGLDEYLQAHIPGAVFLDLQADLSAKHPHLVFMMPKPDVIAAGLAACGVTQDSRVVLYNRGPSWWATRAWFMLEEIGFPAAVLDGGFDKWVAEQRPVEAGSVTAAVGNVVARTGRNNFVAKSAVFNVLNDPGTLLLNALSADQHRGEENPYGRPGHIPGSANVPARSVLAQDGSFKAADALQTLLPAANEATIHYCGGGISASLTAFAQRLLGQDAVKIYDGSLSEWARDPEMPLVVGDESS
jgi:thiosulfate/3-mercaptopyruvate sulfurtransferase